MFIYMSKVTVSALSTYTYCLNEHYLARKCFSGELYLLK